MQYTENPTQPAIEQSETQEMTSLEDQFQTRRVATIAVGHAIHDTFPAFLAPMLPVIITNLSITRAEAGLLATFLSAPSLLQPFIGHLADRKNLRFLVILTPTITAALMSLLGLSESYLTTALMLIAVGLSSAGLHAVGPVIAGKLAGKKLGRAMSFWMVGGEFGRTLGPILIVTTIRFLSPRGTGWLMLAGFLASLLLYFRLRNLELPATHTQTTLPMRSLVRSMRPVMLPLMVIIGLRAFLFSATSTFLPTMLTDEGANLWFAGAALSVMEAAGVLGAMLGGSISDRIGRKPVLLICFTSAPLLMIAFLNSSGAWQFGLLLLYGFAMLSVTPVFMALVQESYPENRALANGLYMAMSFAVSSLTVILIGFIGDHFGLRQAFLLSAGVMLLGLPFLLRLPHPRTIG
ncbi:MAG: MFS transporter [Anaerolineaceae bacterium]|nr:MFS transporter [Anaerolineaceae bacterium]